MRRILTYIVGDGRDDYIAVNALGGVDAWINKGSMDLTPIANLVPNRKDVQPSEVRFADLNGKSIWILEPTSQAPQY